MYDIPQHILNLVPVGCTLWPTHSTRSFERIELSFDKTSVVIAIDSFGTPKIEHAPEYYPAYVYDSDSIDDALIKVINAATPYREYLRAVEYVQAYKEQKRNWVSDAIYRAWPTPAAVNLDSSLYCFGPAEDHIEPWFIKLLRSISFIKTYYIAKTHGVDLHGLTGYRTKKIRDDVLYALQQIHWFRAMYRRNEYLELNDLLVLATKKN